MSVGWQIRCNAWHCLVQVTCWKFQSMEIWNLVNENFSFTKNSSLMSADWNSSAVESVDSVPWSESRWARGSSKFLTCTQTAHLHLTPTGHSMK